MFEEKGDIKKQVNPHSYNPHTVKKPNPKLPEMYEDTPEYRKSLNLEGKEKEDLLKSLRERLGMSGPKQKSGPGYSTGVQWHGEEGEHGHQAAEEKPQEGQQQAGMEQPAAAGKEEPKQGGY